MHAFPSWAIAGFWGLVSGSALIAGSLIGYFINVSQKIIALVMGFGAGVLISALSFELMEEATEKGGFTSTAIGFISGGVIYTIANYIVSNKGAKHRKRSGDQQPSEEEDSG